MSTEGLLLVNKPKGWTSFDVVGFVRKTIASSLMVPPKTIKVGHSGTLDPIATGLLILLVGKKYTKMAQFLSKADKEYVATLKLGFTSPSYDAETVLSKVSNRKPSREEIVKVLKNYQGKIMQSPPAFSAIKVNGKRAYDLARQGQSLELKARQIEIYQLELQKYSYPMLTVKATVSSGTYIRSLINDIGSDLGVGAVMTGLNRSRVGKFKLKDAIAVKQITIGKLDKQIKADPTLV